MFMQFLFTRRGKAGRIEREKQREYTEKVRKREREVEGERERTKNHENHNSGNKMLTFHQCNQYLKIPVPAVQDGKGRIKGVTLLKLSTLEIMPFPSTLLDR